MRHGIEVTDGHLLLDDEHYLAVAKERGWLVHATVDPERTDLYSELKRMLVVRGDADPYLALHHRLDLWTSGVLVFARSRRANKVLAEVFSTRSGTKRYTALCVGRPAVDRGELRHHLARRRVDGIERMVAVDRGGKQAIAQFEVVEEVAVPGTAVPVARLAFVLVTGRMHQLRVQSSLAGFPILGDDLYGDREVNRDVGTTGQLLHAGTLSFHDPIVDREIVLEAPEPLEMSGLYR